jgi:hypothetical protein
VGRSGPPGAPVELRTGALAATVGAGGRYGASVREAADKTPFGLALGRARFVGTAAPLPGGWAFPVKAQRAHAARGDRVPVG